MPFMIKRQELNEQNQKILIFFVLGEEGEASLAKNVRTRICSLGSSKNFEYQLKDTDNYLIIGSF